MFDYKNMLKRAIEFFPTWSDIRKRTKSSIGGQLLDSALKETLELESSINEYKDFYFLNKYDPEKICEEISSQDLEECIKIDKKYGYQEIIKIKAQKDWSAS